MVCKISNLLGRRRDTDSQAIVACVVKNDTREFLLELKDDGSQVT